MLFCPLNREKKLTQRRGLPDLSSQESHRHAKGMAKEVRGRESTQNLEEILQCFKILDRKGITWIVVL